MAGLKALVPGTHVCESGMSGRCRATTAEAQLLSGKYWISLLSSIYIRRRPPLGKDIGSELGI